MEECTKTNPMVCLPCGISDNRNVERHCICCKTCMQELILDAKMQQKDVSCPICRYEFDPQAVEKALNTGCLAYPDGQRYTPRLIKWYPGEKDEKRNTQCILFYNAYFVLVPCWPVSFLKIRIVK